jgi:hypothetical protein
MIRTRRGFRLGAAGLCGVAAACACLASSSPALAEVRPQPEFGQQATWQNPAEAEVRAKTLAWIADCKPDAAVRAQAEALWPAGESNPAVGNKPAGEDTPAAEDAAAAKPARPSAEELLNRLAATFSLVDPPAKDLVDLCRRPRDKVVLPEFAWLSADATPAWEGKNLRLLYGRWLAHERLYDEALAQLEGLQPEDVADPAALLFYQGIVHHHMLDKESGAAALQRMLERADQLPRRYVSVARLMLSDLKDLEDDSLDHIARRMQDIQRRLDLGRAGRKVRSVEDGVIASLDKLIEEIEKQQAAAAAAAAGAQSGRPVVPASDSRILPYKGAGQVDRKPLGTKAGWGELPPKQRHEALQQIGKDYPAHYRDLIEQYFRKLANEDEGPDR